MSGNQVSRDTIDILQEVMNIAFGTATAELAEMIDIFVRLEVPVINILDFNDLMNDSFEQYFGAGRFNFVKQEYLGEFEGFALLVFPEDKGRNLISILNGEDPDIYDNVSMEIVEEGVMLELGNILIGACVTRICELLDTVVQFRPPTVKTGVGKGSIQDGIDRPSRYAIVMKTSFEFTQDPVEGSIIIVGAESSLEWLQRALDRFVESF